jgi:hypothetical protein
MIEEKASKVPRKRDPGCLQVLEDIVIPAGTILRQESGKAGVFLCDVGLTGKLSVTLPPGVHCSRYKRVVA